MTVLSALSRRTLLKGTAAAATVLAAPAIVTNARASSGEVKIFAWAGYISDEMLAAFEKSTGIKPTYTPYGTNDELLNQLRATKGRGFDIIWPTVDRVPNYVDFGLIQPLDDSKIKWDGVVSALVKGSETRGAMVDGKRYQVPSDWGTEALCYNKDKLKAEYGTLSYGDMLRGDLPGKVTLRAHSALIGIGLYLESQGKLPHPLLDQFKPGNEAVARANFDAIVAEAIKAKGNIVQFWSNENEAQGAFRTNGAVLGQTWDSTAYALRKENLPIGFMAPKEGALAWMEGFCIPAGAENLEQAYAFINWFYTPEAGAMYTEKSGIASASVGAEDKLGDVWKSFVTEAYPGDALDKLWWWPVQDPAYVAIRNEYQDRFLSA
ncbi:extracellular solute-binding protein [Caenispirillum bisanense]|uniref:Spermidine/putrescine transport system substrate-binding protein n=1 Tax=Caenispirillum bisanense TaxID=414052 RepID=A0A286GEZ8_9PROT|nr:extracellular solute-binding protein [Caenispirillum bisanense]SOD94080.1 spermidine/putrescine transport system substrate-binding protein [Caenispirillum bisanense]